DALAGELAQIATLEADYPAAVKEWLAAVARVPGYRSSAVVLLSQVPVEGRHAVLRELESAAQPAAERLAATLLVRWADPVGGLRRLERVLPHLRGAGEAVEALQELLEELRPVSSRDGHLARGMGLELLAARVPPAQGSRFWLEAAQAYAE